MQRKDWVQFAIILAIALLIGFTFSVQNYVNMNNRGFPITWRDSFAEQIPFWAVWALLSPLVFRLTSRFPLDRERWWKTVLMHAPVGLAFSIIHFCIYFGILMFIEERDATAVLSLTDFVKLVPKLNFGLRFWSYLLLTSLGYAIDFYNRYQEGLLRASQLQMRLARAQLDALKMQLHPHFLFNTLNSISALVRRDPETADMMIVRLGDFLRMTLRNSGRQEVTVEEEIDFLKCYLEIEKIRFQDRLTIEMTIEPAAAQARVPNLFLQPIVENAIRHGISATSDPGLIAISAKKENGSLQIRVCDNGPGLADSADSRREGLGLQNTRSRLQQLYGTSYRFEYYNSQNGGVTVDLEIPYHTDIAEELQ